MGLADFNDDLLVSNHALQRYSTEANSGAWHATFGRSHGRLVTTLKSDVITPEPEPVQRMFVDDMSAALNKELHHDGAWAMLLTDPIYEEGGLVLQMEREFNRFCMIWMDADGDIQFTVENDEPLWEVLVKQKLYWMEQAEEAWQHWKHLMRDVLAPSEAQLGTRVH